MIFSIPTTTSSFRTAMQKAISYPFTLLQRSLSLVDRVIGTQIAILLALGILKTDAHAELPERPNFLIILADDAGFSDTGMYGSEIETPVLDGLAENGLRFTNFYSTARCWPSRAAIMTGYYPQQVRMDPLRREMGSMPPWTQMLPHYLEQAGYRSYHSGKWHIFLEDNPVADGGFARSYRLRDPDRFFSPKQHYLDDEPLPEVGRDEGYYSTVHKADRVIEFLSAHAEHHADKPWFTYLCFTAPHFPLHALPEDIAKYEGRYDAGWDAIRRERLEQMKRLGLIDMSVPLPPLEPAVVPPWNMISRDMEAQFGKIEDRGAAWRTRPLEEAFGPGEVGRAMPWVTLTSEQQTFQAKKMEIHAAMIDRMDQEIGRVIEHIEAMGDRENTVIIYLSDNGASAEIIERGDMHDPDAPMGSAGSYLSLGPGWATASNTPFRLHKHYTHEGGAASPLIINWPDGLDPSVHGAIRHTPGHFVDLLPTLLDLAGLEDMDWADDAPPFPGRTLVPSLNNDAEIEREFIFFEHQGHRALRIGDWKIVSRTDDHDRWKLYNLARDRNELNDLSAFRTDRVHQMSQRWQELYDKYEAQSLRDWNGE